MAQRASTETVVGAFDGRAVRYAEQAARPFERPGRFFIDLPTKTGHRRAEVALAVGSLSFQQYFERDPRGDGLAFLRLARSIHEKSGAGEASRADRMVVKNKRPDQGAHPHVQR